MQQTNDTASSTSHREAPMGTLPQHHDVVSALAEQALRLGPVFRLPAVRPTYVLSGPQALAVFSDDQTVERSASLFPADALLALQNDDTVPLSATNGEEHQRRRAAWNEAGILDRASLTEALPRLQHSVDATFQRWQGLGIFSLNLETRRACWRLGTLSLLGSERGEACLKDVDTLFSAAPLEERQAAKQRLIQWLDAEIDRVTAPSVASRLMATGSLSRPELINELNHGLLAGLFLAQPLTAMLHALNQDPDRLQAVRAENEALGQSFTLADIRRTPLLLKLIDEALRLTSPIPMVFARSKTALTVDGVAIPAGATLIGGLHGTNQMLGLTPSGTPQDIAPPAHGLAFGVGSHSCPAANQSTVTLWLFATRLLATYDFDMLDAGDVPVRQAGVWQAPRGAYVQFVRGRLERSSAPQPRRLTTATFPTTTAATGPIPTPDRQARIAIVGAGITGLTLAHELRKRGYEHVTVFERESSVGGKADTTFIDGRPYNHGAHLCSGNRGVAALAADVGVTLERSPSYVLWDMDQNRAVPRQYRDQAEFNKLRRLIDAQPEIDSDAGFAAAESAMYAQVDRWLAANDLGALRDIGPFFTGAGYGFMHEDVPAAFFLKFAKHMNEDGWTPTGGYKHLLERVSEGLHVRCSTEVLRVQRSSADKAGVRLTTRAASDHGELQHELFDRVILTGPLEHAHHYVDLSADESALFSRIRSDDYYTVIATLNIERPHPTGLYIVTQSTAKRGEGCRTTAFARMFEDSQVYHFFCYGEPGQSEESVLEQVRADARQLGGEIDQVHFFRKWAYSPRVAPHDMALGYHTQLERMQGQSGTYYAGSLLAFELTDHNVLFAKNLVERCFPGDAHGDTAASGLSASGQGADPASRLPETGMQSILEIVRERYEQTPDTLVSTFLDVKGKEVRSLSYKTLVERAMACAVSLQDAKVRPGDRVALVYPPDTDEFLIGFMGCLFAQAVAVPIACPDPRKLDVDIPRFAHLMSDSGCQVALTTRLYYTAALVGRAWHRITKGAPQQAQWPKLTWIRTDGLSPLAPNARMPIPSPSADTLAYLQYTSGSTSDPKGVMINHGNILHNVEAIRRQTNVTADSVLVGWVPLFHDMGLVGGPLNAIYTGSRMVFFSPMSFLQNPRLWIEAMSKYRATHTESPNFGYEFLLRRLDGDALQDIDLSHLTHALFGGEAMRHRTFERMAERLQSTGFKPQAMTNIFGAAEATLFLAGGNDGRTPLLSVDTKSLQSSRRAVPQSPNAVSTTTLIGCLIPADGCDLRIVDPETTSLLPEREVGEIWLSSPSVAQGYWGRTAEDNDRTFRARIEGDPTPLRTYLRTGDLGFIDGGVLYICGRHKEMMIFQGRNIYPMDIEASVMTAHPAIRQGCVAAFSVEDGEQEGLVVVAEIKAAAQNDAAAAASAIAVEVAAQHQLTCKAVVLVRSDALPKTSSGKLQRYRAREAYLAGKLQVILTQTPEHGALSHLLPAEEQPAAPDTTVFDGDEATTRAWLQRLVASTLQVAPEEVSTSISLFMFGIGSAQAMSITTRVSQFVGKDLPASALFEHPTIDELAAYLCGKAPGGSRVLVPMQRGNTELAPILFCVHPVGGSAMAYTGLVEQLPDSLGVYAFDNDGSEVPCDDVVHMAQRYIQEMQAVQKTGPYHLVGYSFGGTVAYEMARQLLSTGEEVRGLYLIDSPAPVYQDAEAVPRLDEAGPFEHFLQTAMFNRIISDELDDEARALFMQRVEANNKALTRYRITRDKHAWPEITLYRADEEAQHLREYLRHPAFDQADFGWSDASPGSSIVVTKVPGDHFSVMNEPKKLAALLVRSVWLNT